jgi:putative oxidoreductase
MKATLDPLSPHLLSVLRIMSGLLFLEHGTSKLLGVPPSAMHWSFQIASLAGWSGILEFVGGILLVIGLFTRFTAFILSGEMAVAYFTVHAPKGFYPMMGGGNGGEIAVLYCFVFLYLAAAGGGPWSLDRLRHRG